MCRRRMCRFRLDENTKATKSKVEVANIVHCERGGYNQAGCRRDASSTGGRRGIYHALFGQCPGRLWRGKDERFSQRKNILGTYLVILHADEGVGLLIIFQVFEKVQCFLGMNTVKE